MEPKTLYDAIERAKTDPQYAHALRGSLKHYPGCPSCEWRKGSCADCHIYRAQFLAPKSARGAA